MTTEHIHVVKQSTVPHAAHTVVHARPGDDQLDPASTHTAAAAPNATGKLKDRAVPPKEHWQKNAIVTLRAALEQEVRLTPESIPQAYLESERIVDPRSPQALSFQRSMEELTQRLLPKLDLAKHPITFVMADAGIKNAYIVTTEKQSLICFDLKILETFDNLDQLAWVLLHELTHLQYRGHFGNIPNSQIEEGWCDIRPLWAMHDAGLNPAEASTYALKMVDNKKPPPWMALVGVHALPASRVTAIDDGLVLLIQMKGVEPNKNTHPLPADFQLEGALKGANHESYLTRAFAQQEYSSKSALEKLRILQDSLAELEPRFHRRLEDIQRRLREIPVAPDDKAERQILIEMMDFLLDNPTAFNALHLRIRTILDGDNPKSTRYYAPRLRQLAKTAREFIDSEESDSDMEKAVAAAAFVRHLESLPAWQSIDWSTVDLPSFDLPSKREYQKALRRSRTSGDDVVFPWHELAEAASPSNQIARALFCLGTWDDRIPQSLGDRDLKWVSEHVKTSQRLSGLGRYSATVSSPKDAYQELTRALLITKGDGTIKRVETGMDGSTMSPERALEERFSEKITEFVDSKRIDNASQAAPLRPTTNTTPEAAPRAKTGKLTFTDLPYAEFMREPDAHLLSNRDSLSPSYELPSSASIIPRSLFQQVASQTAQAAGELLRYFDGMLGVTTEFELEQHRTFVKNFFLRVGKSDDVNFDFLKSRMLDMLDGSNSIEPYLNWVADDKHKLFTLPEKGAALGEFSNMPQRFYRRVIMIEAPQTVSDLNKAIDLYIGLYLEQLNWNGDSIKMSYSAISGEVCEYLRTHKKDLGPVWKLFSTHGAYLEKFARTSEVTEILGRYLEQETEWPTDPTALGSIYRSIDALGLFPNEEWRASFTARVIRSIDDTEDLHGRIAALENLLLGRPLRDVDLRSGAIDRWVESVATQFGLDDTPSWQTAECPYLDKIQPVIDRIAHKASSDMRDSMLRKLGTRIVAQRQVSFALEKGAFGIIDERSPGTLGLAYGASQTLVALLTSKEFSRRKTLQFLTQPLDAERLRRFSRTIDRDAGFLGNLLPLFDSDDSQARTNRRIELECKRLHENFWQAPMPVRLAALKGLLIPPDLSIEDRMAGNTQSFDKACEFVISELLPLKDKAGQPIKYAAEARRLLSAFLAPGVLYESQRPVFLAALMAATQRSNEETTQLSVGQRLATIFDAMGPAWRKFGQAISSHPSTPPDIARDMEPLKGNSSVSRHEAWALYEQTVPETIRVENPRLGPVLEFASFFTAVDAGEDVFTFLTPNALERAELGFKTMERFIDELSKADDTFSPMAPAVSEMVQSSRTSAALETNGMVGAAQSDAMRSRYQGLVVHMGDQSYPVSTAAWRDHGPEFRRMKKMKGPTFNDLPTRTDEERLHKRNIAKAILYVELRNILSGDPFCVDRHGRNIRINNNAIGHFDHGAVHAVVRDTDGHQVNPIDADKALRAGGTVEIPGASKEELLQLAEALYSSFQQLAAHAPLAVVIHNEIAKAREASGETPEYLIRVERALLALNDCFKCLDQEGQDIKDLLGSLYLNNEVHPTICAELEKKIAKEKVGGLLGRFVKISSRVRTEVGTMIREKIHTSVHTTESMPASHWHDHPKNTREFTTLLGTKDYEVQRSEKRQKTRRRSSES